ncbi:MAG: hypothetical protein ACI867_001630 [Glaciecola sp.]
MSPARWRQVAFVFASIFLLVLAASYVGKAVCVDGERDFWAVTRYCYSDIHVLWGFRGFDVDALPYAGAPAGYVVDYTFEYPPGLGFGSWFMALLTDSRRGFFALTSVTLALSGIATFVATTAVLRREGASPWWLAGLALSPAVLLFSFQNWDWWALAPAVIGVAFAHRGKGVAAGVMFGIGAAMKWWPGLLVVLLLAGPWAAGRDRHDGQRLKPLAAFIGTALLLQVPAVLVSPRGWLDAHLFHAERSTNIESGLQGIHDLAGHLWPSSFWDGGFWTIVSVGSVLALSTGLVVIGRRLHQGRMAPLDGALAIVVLFLLTSRVASPQFLLWLIPFAVMARAPWIPVLAVEMLNAINWILYAPVLAGADRGFTFAAQTVGGMRRVVLGWLLYEVLRRSARPRPRSESPSIESPAPVAGSGAGDGSGVGADSGAGAAVAPPTAALS